MAETSGAATEPVPITDNLEEQDDDHVSIASSCGSLSFVITDDQDVIDAAAGLSYESFMTKSQYARVVFHDIADRYPNNRDLLIMYTLCGDLEAVEFDRIGLFRVPNFAPHENLAMKWVSTSNANPEAQNKIVDAKKKIYSIVFEGSTLPKDEDFYQFQYLRNNEVFGASVPFQLRGGEELCTTEADEFERVDRESDIAHRSLIEKISSLTAEQESLKTKLDESETKCTELKNQLEDLESETKRKNDSFMILDEKFKSFQDDSSKALEQLRMDFACALQDKLILEERLHKGQKAVAALQTERDSLSGKVNQLTREKRILEEELTSLHRRLDEDRNMFVATTKAKELAIQEIKAYIIRNDELQKVVDRLQREVEASHTQCESLKMVLDSLKAKFEDAERSKEAGDREKDLIIEDLTSRLDRLTVEKDAEIDRLSKSLSLKQKEFEVLSTEMVNRSKNKFQQIDVLKKQLAETERSLNKCLNGPSPSASLDPASVLESLSQLEIDDDSEVRIKNLETRILALHSEFKKVEQNHADEIKSIREDLESIRSGNSMTSSMSSNDSRKMMDSHLINTMTSAMRSQLSVTDTESDVIVLAKSDPPSGCWVPASSVGTSPPLDRIQVNVVSEEGKSVKMQVKTTAELRKVKKGFCDRFRVSENFFNFMFEGYQIKDEDTPLKLKMQNGDKIDVFRKQDATNLRRQTSLDESQPQGARRDSNDNAGSSETAVNIVESSQTSSSSGTIQLRTVYQGGHEIIFKIKPSCEMTKLKTAFANRLNKPLSSFIFIFKGWTIQDNETPLKLGMKENDIIHVYPADSYAPGVISAILPRLDSSFLPAPSSQKSSEGSLPEPLVPEKAADSPTTPKHSAETTIEEDFNALTEWAKGYLMPKRRRAEETHENNAEGTPESNPQTGPPSQVLLTDDGRTVEAPVDKIICPFCQKQYEVTEVEGLQSHVESHMDRQLKCPVCEVVFETQDGNSTAYQEHVQGHFPEDSLTGDNGGTRQPRDSFWFLDFD